MLIVMMTMMVMILMMMLMMILMMMMMLVLMMMILMMRMRMMMISIMKMMMRMMLLMMMIMMMVQLNSHKTHLLSPFPTSLTESFLSIIPSYWIPTVERFLKILIACPLSFFKSVFYRFSLMVPPFIFKNIQ